MGVIKADNLTKIASTSDKLIEFVRANASLIDDLAFGRLECDWDDNGPVRAEVTKKFHFKRNKA